MGKKILVVDDDRTMNTLLKTLLELDGFVVVMASRGEVVVPGAKNSVLKLMAATVLAPGQHVLHRVLPLAFAVAVVALGKWLVSRRADEPSGQVA